MHTRKRHIEKILAKRAKMFPVLGVLGPRQVGKSTFLTRQWSGLKSAAYMTFDKQEIVLRAKRSSEQFLLDESHHQERHLIIDEAQKVPHIFDSIKALVDENRRMGAFTLSGSVDFSSKAGVRESLAGRMGTTRLYPMTLREINSQELNTPWINFDFNNKAPLKPKSVETWLERGGMPIFCNLSDLDERIAVTESWLEAICYRDIKQLEDGEYDSDLTYQLLSAFAANPKISISKLSAAFGATHHYIKKHLSALMALFLIYEIPSFANPKAQPMYRIFDAGVLNILIGGKPTVFSRQSCLITLLINEIYSQYEYAGKQKPKLYYYKSRGGAKVDLILKTRNKIAAIDCTTTVDITPYKQRGIRSFLNKNKDAVGYIIAPVQQQFRIDNNIFVIPWESIG